MVAARAVPRSGPRPTGRPAGAPVPDSGGLTQEEAARRLVAEGPNELPPARRQHLALRFLHQFTDFFAIVLEVAAAVTLAAYLIQRPHEIGNLQLCIAICGVVVLNAGIGFVQEYSAERTAEGLQRLLPELAHVMRSGQVNEIPARELVPGDLLLLEAGESVPADARVLEADGLAVDMSALTGESRPVLRRAALGALEDERPELERRDLVFMGTSVSAGRGRAVVSGTGLHTEFGHIYRLTTQVHPSPTPLQRQVRSMALRVGAIAISAAIVVLAVRVLVGTPLVPALVLSLGVMVALVPEGLPATLSVSLAVGVRRMARRQALIKKLLAVEALGATTVICTDKTGTLTTGQMTVQAVWAGGVGHAVSGAGYDPAGEVEDPALVIDVLRAALLCSDARLLPPDPEQGKDWRVVGDTTEGALVVAAAKAGLSTEEEGRKYSRLSELPFDPVRKMMTTVHRAGEGRVALTKGALQEVLPRCANALWDGRILQLDETLRARISGAGDAMAGQALRVLAVARRRLPAGETEQIEHDLTFLGLIGMLDPPRPEVPAAIADCRRAGIRLVMVTGDDGVTGRAVAARLGMIGSEPVRVLDAAGLAALSADDLTSLLRSGISVLFARVRPQDKLRVVQAFQELGAVVAVTGDGINDTPALRRADIGVAMGRGGTDLAREAAEMILLDNSFASIAAAIELGRSVYLNIRRFLIYLFSHNLAELAPILAATAVGFPLLPITALQILAIDLGSDVLPALALGAEPPEPGVMDRPPRPPRARLFSPSLVGRFAFLGAMQSVAVVAVFFWKVHSTGLPFTEIGYGNPTYREALTMVQAGIVVMQAFNGFAVQTDLDSVFRAGLFRNRWLVAGELLGLALMAAISYLGPLQAVFHTAPLTLADWSILFGCGAILFTAEELRKLALRHWHRA